MKPVYWVSRALIWCWVKVWLRARCVGQEHIPSDGPVVMASNHASHLDPLILGSFVPRRCWYVARSSLGRIPLAGAWMRAVGIIFINRKTPGRDAMGRVIDTLLAGEVVGMFPEGTRSRDGRLGAFQRGLLLLLKKSQARVVPVGIRGSFAALPPGSLFPRPRHCSVHFGRSWSADEVLAPGGLEALRREVAELSASEMA